MQDRRCSVAKKKQMMYIIHGTFCSVQKSITADEIYFQSKKLNGETTLDIGMLAVKTNEAGKRILKIRGYL